jgi:6-phosphogluconate dehydrogenase (decarboxylating)
MHLPEAIPFTRTDSGPGQWRAEGAVELGVVGDIVTASDHQRISAESDGPTHIGFSHH